MASVAASGFQGWGLMPMTSARENYSYTASGLPYVTLVGVEVRRHKGCGEHEVVIPRIEQVIV